MDANWQTERCSCCRVGDAPSTDLPLPFLSPFIRFFDHPHLLSLAAIVAAWKWWNTSRSHLYTTAWHVLCNDLRDLRMWRTGGLPFPFAGWSFWGWVYNNQYQNENGYVTVTHPVLTQPLFDKFNVPFLLQVVVAGGGSTTTNIKIQNEYQMVM